MNAFWTFLLFVAAFVGTTKLLGSPIKKLVSWANGKRKKEIDEDVEEWIEEKGTGAALVTGCGFLLYLLVSVFYTFVVEPAFVIAAIINHLGNLYIAYAMLAIVAVSWILSIKSIKLASQVSVSEKEANPDEIVEINISFWSRIQGLLFSLPTLYLWYVFFVVIGIF